MKKISLIALFAALVMSVNATDLWTGSKHVSWDDGGLQIAANQFAAAQPGNLIKVHFTGATDGIEFKVMNEHFDHLAGSREAAWISGDGAFEQFLTPNAVDSLKAHGLEIIGANFTCTKVELLAGKGELQKGFSVWTGYFWVNDWVTLELYRDGYAGVDWSKAKAIRFYAGATAEQIEAINVLESWEAGGKIADKGAMTAGSGYMELPLTAELRTRLAGVGHWMIQYARVEPAEFNVTDIVIVMEEGPSTAIDNTVMGEKAIKTFENGQLVIIKNGIKYNAMGVQL
jgi:hypothetical protein